MDIGTIKSPGWDKAIDELNELTGLNKVVWKGTTQCTYKFENPNKEGWWIKNFMKYIRSCERYGMVATKKHFLKLVGKRNDNSYMNTFFCAVKDAGIVTLHKKWNGKFTESTYTRGYNWNVYLEGRLRRV